VFNNFPRPFYHVVLSSSFAELLWSATPRRLRQRTQLSQEKCTGSRERIEQCVSFSLMEATGAVLVLGEAAGWVAAVELGSVHSVHT